MSGEGQGGGCVPNSGSYGFSNDDQYAFEIGKHLLIGESQHEISARREPSIAHRIIPLLRIEVVRFSIKLYDDVRAVTDEVEHVSSHRRLSAERNSIEMMRLEIAPEQNLRARHRASQMLRPVALLLADGGVRHARSPPSLSLPRKGGGNPQTSTVLSHHELRPPASVGRSSGRKP